MLPTTIDFRITSECNMCCPFCFGTKEQERVEISAQIDFLRKFRTLGVKNIVFTGGEPACFPEFSRVLRLIHSLGYRIALSTNGSCWENKEIRDAIVECVSYISFPIESTDREVHNSLRTGIPNHFEKVYRILQDISCSKPSIHVKICTVVTKTNIESLAGILDVLPLEPDIWKLYQLSSCDFNRCFYNTQRITNDQFKDCITELQRIYKTRSTKIVSGYEFDRDRKYLFLEPNGSLKTIINNQETRIGHISDREDRLCSQIESMVDYNRINTNFCNSFS